MSNLKCPICKKEVAAASEDLPFCSARCKLIDLGNWASEKYVISTPVRPSEVEPEDDDPSDRERSNL